MFSDNLAFSKTFMIVIGGIFLIFLISLSVIACIYGNAAVSYSPTDIDVPRFVINEKIYRIEYASTDAARTLGLSNREGLPQNRVLLFVFPESDYWGIWMKDMKFPIDILWLDTDYRIIGIKEEAKQDSFPEVFTPKSKALYVVEANAGFVRENSLTVGAFLRPITDE